MHVPNIVFLVLALVHPPGLVVVSSLLALEQFGYGLGFTAYLMAMIWFAGRRPGQDRALRHLHRLHGARHDAARHVSGALQDAIGYMPFFAWVLVATIPSLVMTALLRVPEGFGREEAT